MKNFKKLLLLILILPMAFLFSACAFNSEVYITNIQKYATVGTTDVYMITYSNGTTSSFAVQNGTNGINGENFTIETLEACAKEKHMTIEEYLANYLNINYCQNPVKTATNKAMQSAVSIYVEHPVLDNYMQQTNELFCGSGVIYKMDSDYSYIITNYHVIHYDNSLNEDKIASKINIYQYGENEAVYENKNGSYSYTDGAVKCEFVGGSDKYDLAIIKTPTEKLLANNPTACAVTIAEKFSLADTVIAAGNPKGYGLSATEGIISVVNETIDLYDNNGITYTTYRVMRIDAAVNGGNSGGGLFNINGELVGIVNAKIVSNDVDNMAYAIPFDNVVKIAENVIYYHKQTGEAECPKQLYMGISYTEKNHKSVYNKEDNEIYLYSDCVIALDPEAGCLGYEFDFKKDDIVKSATIKRGSTILKTEIEQAFQLADFTLTIRPGDSVCFIVERNGETITLGDLNFSIVEDSDLIECDKTNYKKTSK